MTTGSPMKSGRLSCLRLPAELHFLPNTQEQAVNQVKNRWKEELKKLTMMKRRSGRTMAMSLIKSEGTTPPIISMKGTIPVKETIVQMEKPRNDPDNGNGDPKK